MDTMIRLLKIKEMENPSNDNGKSQFTTKTPGNCAISFPNGKEDIMNFDVTITPDDGFYMYHTRNTKCLICFILFHRNNLISVFIAREAYLLLRLMLAMYTHIIFLYLLYALTYFQVCHPYIDFEGKVFLNILRNDWKPVFTITNVVDGIYHLFTATFTSSDRCLSTEH
ncbi:hypothetical protein LXL04_029325 [Taraxacum kok-saghyz]